MKFLVVTFGICISMIKCTLFSDSNNTTFILIPRSTILQPTYGIPSNFEQLPLLLTEKELPLLLTEKVLFGQNNVISYGNKNNSSINPNSINNIASPDHLQQPINLLNLEMINKQEIPTYEFISKTMDVRIFVRRAEKILKSINKDVELDDTASEILEYIFEELYENPNELALFVASSFFNTSYFTSFKSKSDEKYCSRGLMMLNGEDNYKRLNKISSLDFFNKPELLEKINRNSVYANIDFWKKYIFKASYGLKNSFKSYVIKRLSDTSVEDPSVKDFCKIYFALLKMFSE